jgi:lysophospholipase L1-like esterase
VSVEVGFKKGARVEPPSRRRSGIERPVVFYGTSITQGASASRPGLGYVNLIGRQLDVPVVNLGFSGNGNMGGDIGEYLARIDASCYVIDTLWNMGNREVEERYGKFIDALKLKKPGVPIILVGQCNVYNRTPNPKDALAKAVAARHGLKFVDASQLYENDSEGSIDGTHPNDLGFYRMASVIEPVIKEILEEKFTK